MTMFYTPEGGEQTAIPEEHEKVLALYRDSMPLVWEPQYTGDTCLYPLIDEQAESCDTPDAGELEAVAESTARRLRAVRMGETDGREPDFERLATAAVRAYLESEYLFTAAIHQGFTDDCGENCVRHAEQDAKDAGARLKRTVTRLVREVIRDMEPMATEGQPGRLVAGPKPGVGTASWSAVVPAGR